MSIGDTKKRRRRRRFDVRLELSERTDEEVLEKAGSKDRVYRSMLLWLYERQCLEIRGGVLVPTEKLERIEAKWNGRLKNW